ncbi:SDR family oxidoreductase [bacterium]|nr:SDR family oxidoreductase [bacterium]
MNFENKVVIITGGTGALGYAVTTAFLQAGAKVLVTFTRETEFDALKSRVGGHAATLRGVKTNVLDEASVQAMAQEAAEPGRIDVLVNLVGGFLGGVPVVEMTLEQWDKIINLNLKSAFLCCKHVMPVMQQQRYGRIINIGSQGGLHGGDGISAYGAAKAGLINFTKSLAAEGKGFGISANAVVPGNLDTPANRQAMPNADFTKWVSPQVVAQVILFLASSEASAITGAVIPVSGRY